MPERFVPKPEPKKSRRVREVLRGFVTLPADNKDANITGKVMGASMLAMGAANTTDNSTVVAINMFLAAVTLVPSTRDSVLSNREKESQVDQPSVAKLKKNPERLLALGTSAESRSLRSDLIDVFLDKGVDVDAISGKLLSRRDRKLVAELFSNLVLRRLAEDRLRFSHDMLRITRRNKPSKRPYRGTPLENQEIDAAIAEGSKLSESRRINSARGATKEFYLGNVDVSLLKESLLHTKVIVIGGGPAGLLATRAMLDAGFSPHNITVIDKTGSYGGVWNQKNVSGGSRNNPFTLYFEGMKLYAAPGSGESVKEFLVRAESGFPYMPKPTKGVVVGVTPGDLDHVVTFQTQDGEKTISAPIVINALGNGRPLPPSREGHMTTDTPEAAGIRWQQVLSEKAAERLRGKSIVMIGLGNSTAEMLTQIQALNRRGFNIDYKILTHFPREAVENPKKKVTHHGREYRVYRDLSLPNLVKWEGDLNDARFTYVAAEAEGRIVPEVTHWDLRDGKIEYTLESGEVQSFDCDQLYTLIGYGQDPDTLRSMGMTVTDEYAGTIAYDYDGEIQRKPGAQGRERVYPGYFGLGSVLKSPENPNAQVIPGIMHRIYDLLFTAALRGFEYEHRRTEKLELLSNLPTSR